MIRKALFAAASIALLAATPSFGAAKPCRDAHGHFTKCGAAVAAKPVHCKLNGKFAKCGTPGARPV